MEDLNVDQKIEEILKLFKVTIFSTGKQSTKSYSLESQQTHARVSMFV